MKVGLVGFPGSGKTTVYNALTGQRAETGYAGKGSGKTNLGVVKVPDPRIDALAASEGGSTRVGFTLVAH